MRRVYQVTVEIETESNNKNGFLRFEEEIRRWPPFHEVSSFSGDNYYKAKVTRTVAVAKVETRVAFK